MAREDIRNESRTIRGRVNTEEEARKMPYGHRKSRYTYLQKKTYKLNEEETSNIHELTSKIKKANMDELVKIGSDEKGYKHMNPGQRAVASMAGYRRENNGNLVLTSHNGLWKEKDYDSFRRSLDKQGVKKFVSDDGSTGFQDFAKSMLNNGWQIDGVTTYKTTTDWGAPRDYTGFVFKKKQK